MVRQAQRRKVVETDDTKEPKSDENHGRSQSESEARIGSMKSVR